MQSGSRCKQYDKHDKVSAKNASIRVQNTKIKRINATFVFKILHKIHNSKNQYMQSGSQCKQYDRHDKVSVKKMQV